MFRKYTSTGSLDHMSRKKLRLLKRKILLSMALKSLYRLIKQSKETSKRSEPTRESPFTNIVERTQEDLENYDDDDVKTTIGPWVDNQHSTVIPWWARTVRHGKRRKRKKRSSFLDMR